MGTGVAATVFALSYANGGFSPTTRAYAGMAAWWLLGVGAAFGIASARSGIARIAVVALGLFAAFAIWILISISWASDAERAFAQFDQVALYVAVLAIAIVLARLVPAPVLVGGVAVALCARRRHRARQPVLSQHLRLADRLPGLAGAQESAQLPARLLERLGNRGRTRLPAAVLDHGLAAAAGPHRARGFASAGPRCGDVPRLRPVGPSPRRRWASWRCSLLTPRRWATFTAVVVAGAAGAVAVAVLVPKHALVDGDVDSALGVHQGHHAALWIGIVVS